jgi:hypothetical protein
MGLRRYRARRVLARKWRSVKHQIVITLHQPRRSSLLLTSRLVEASAGRDLRAFETMVPDRRSAGRLTQLPIQPGERWAKPGELAGG